MKHVGVHLTTTEAREFVEELEEYTDLMLDAIRAKVKAELEAEAFRDGRESGLHCLFENLKHAKELCACLMAEMGAMAKEM